MVTADMVNYYTEESKLVGLVLMASQVSRAQICSDHGNLSRPNCSKLTMSLVNDSLKFTLSDTQIC